MIKFENFCTAKETISQVRRQPSEWQKIIGNETMDKGVISKISSSSCNSIPEKQTTQSKMWGKYLSRYFSEEDILMANKYMK